MFTLPSRRRSTLEMVDVRWPRLGLAAVVAQKGIRAPREAKASVTRRVTANSDRLPVNVRMAVVRGPGREAKTDTYVPALKVGIEPQAVPVRNAYRRDAGEFFYIDLIRGCTEFAGKDERDAAT